jgi:acyl carrier protein
MTDEQLTPSSPVCAFNYEGATCANSTDGNGGYCPPHRAQLEEEVRRGVYELIEDELGVDPQEITPNARFIDDLGADSLDLPELMMRLEEVFEVELSTEIEERMQSVKGVVSGMVDLLSQERKFYVYDQANFVPHEHSEAQKERSAERVLGVTAGGELFQDYFKQLGLNAGEVEKLFKMVVRYDRLHHVTTAPKYVGDSLMLVDVFFLGGRRLYYFKLTPDSVTFQSAALDEVRLAYTTEFDEEGKISKITVWSEKRNPDVGEDGEKSIYDVEFEFEKAAGVKGALGFLRKYLSNLEGDR